MGFIGQARYVDLRIVDDSQNPVTGRHLSNWTIIFQRDDVNCTDSLSLLDHGDGRYTVMYTPTAVGHDYVDIYDALYDIRAIDIDEIADLDVTPGGGGGGGDVSFAINLDQDYGSPNALLITAADPASYTLYVFNSSDWTSGVNTPDEAIGSSPINSDGTWGNQIPVNPGTYHIVIVSPTTTTIVAPFLVVS